MAKFDRLFNKIIAKKLQMEQENAFINRLEEQQRIEEERQANPYYMALKALQDERDKFIDFYQSGLMLGFQVNATEKLASKEDSDSKSLNAIESYYG